MTGKVHRLMDQGVMAVIIGIAQQSRMAEVKIDSAIDWRLGIQGLSILYKTDGIGMPVLILIHGNETAGDAYSGITQLPEPAIDPGLTKKLIEPAIRVIVARKEDLSDILSQGGLAVSRAGILVDHSLTAVGAVCKHRSIPVNAITGQRIHFLQGQKGQGHLDGRSRIKILQWVDPEVVIMEPGTVMTVAVDTRIDQLIAE